LTSLEELQAGSVDLAVVATPTSTHESTVLRLLDLGVHVLVEKPIADTAAAGRRMAQRAEEKNLVGAVGHIERFNPAIQELKKRLSAGDIGEVYQIATRRQGSFPARIGDVGVAKDLATHDIDLTAWVADSAYEFVFAQAAHKSGRQHEDMISVTGRLRSGVVVNHLVNWLSPMKERVVIVTGDKGSFVADTLTGDLTLHENGAFAVEWDSFATFRGVTEGNVTRFAYPKKEPLKAELEAFRDAVSGDFVNVVTFSEGVEVVRVAEAVLESSATDAPVSL
jgi:predicted dehydrogenase